MRTELLQWLACPACGEAPLTIEVHRAEERPTFRAHGVSPEHEAGRGSVEEVIEAELTCPGCDRSYPVTGGIPRMLPTDHEGPAESAHAWTTFDRAHREWEETFRDFMAPLEPDDFLGRLTLDAGCGYGRHAHFAARYGAEVVAMDRSADAVDATRRNTRDLYRVHVVQGDIYQPPFRLDTFDLVYSLGVLHHLDRPREAFERLGQCLKSGGRLSVWVYGPRQGLAAAVTRWLRGAADAMSAAELHNLSRGIALGLRIFSHAPYRSLQHVPGGRALVSHLPVHDHHRWPFDVLVADIYDRLRIPVTVTLTGEELERWFEEAGYANIVVTRRVRNNESFRGTGILR